MTVADAIRMVRFANGLYEIGEPSTGLVAIWSPDSARFALVVKRGNLEDNTNEYTLILLKAPGLLGPPSEPDTLVTMSSSSNRPGITSVKWINLNTVAFLGEKAGGRQQLYALDCTTRKLVQLTNSPSSVVAYDATADLRQIIWLAEEPIDTSAGEKGRRTGVVVSTQPLADVLRLSAERAAGVKAQLFVRRRDGTMSQLGSGEPMWGLEYPWDWWQLSLSPDGSYAIMQTRLANVPDRWKQYTNTDLLPFIRAAGEGPAWVFQYLLINVATGLVQPLLDSPNGNGNLPKYVWASDGKSVFASKVFLPLNVTDSNERRTRRREMFVMQVKLPGGEPVAITDRDLDVVQWDTSTQQLVLRPHAEPPQAAGPLIRYKESGLDWEEVRASLGSARARGRVQISLDEDLNTPPRIVARATGSNEERLLLDLNPQLKELTLAKVEVITWKATDGHRWEGGLYLPPNYVRGKRYPLVIQTHGFSPDRFYVDGPFTTAFAAQALAGQGVLVLQIGIDKDRDKQLGPWDPRTGPRAMASYQGAIDYLEARRLVDRRRVGLIGFSATCYGVLYTLTHSRYHFAAAAVTDGIDGGYFQYMLTANTYSPADDFSDHINGGPPFGSSLASWLKHAPDFNMDKVSTPLRIEAIGAFSVVAMWEWLAGLRRLGKPAEMTVIPDGVHILQKPWDRMVSQGGNVDWFRFWLQGWEAPESAKHEQYVRWRRLREQQPLLLRRCDAANRRRARGSQSSTLADSLRRSGVTAGVAGQTPGPCPHR